MVLHIPAHWPTLLPTLLNRVSALPAAAADNATIQSGQVYVAPPDYHLVLEKSKMRLSRSPLENRHRPAIDPLFCSAAHAFGRNVIGIILTGYLDDGAAGLAEIKRHGGIAIVQDPKDAEVPAMPENALKCVEVDHCVPVAKMGKLIMAIMNKEKKVAKA